MIPPVSHLSEIPFCALDGDGVGGHFAPGLCEGLGDSGRTSSLYPSRCSAKLSSSRLLPKSRRSSCRLFRFLWLSFVERVFFPDILVVEKVCLRFRGLSRSLSMRYGWTKKNPSYINTGRQDTP